MTTMSWQLCKKACFEVGYDTSMQLVVHILFRRYTFFITCSQINGFLYGQIIFLCAKQQTKQSALVNMNKQMKMTSFLKGKASNIVRRSSNLIETDKLVVIYLVVVVFF